MSERKPKRQISVRLDSDDLDYLRQVGQAAKPVPANVNQMIGVAVREWVERDRKSKGAK